MSVSALSPRAQDIHRRVKAFLADHMEALRAESAATADNPDTRWTEPPLLEELKVTLISCYDW